MRHMEKQCFKCKESKPISEFYKHPYMGDGRLGKCKTCTKRDVAENAELLKNDPHWVFKERARCRIKQARYRKRGLAKQSLGAQKRWYERHKNKKRAQGVAARSVKTGKIKVKTNCESCGVGGRLHKHHPDYSLPNLVVWLCPKCHGIAHRKPLGAPLPL